MPIIILHQTRRLNPYSFFTAFLILFLFTSCHHKAKAGPASTKDSVIKTNTSAYNYDITKWTAKWELPASLLEISGNAWVDKDHLLVIEDTHPDLYLLKLLDKTVEIEKTIPFANDDKGEKIDIEDITLAGDTAYALWSHGIIFKIKDWRNKAVTEQVPTFLSKENNTEGIAYDPLSNSLLVACKEMSDMDDEKKSTKAIYQFDLPTNTLKQQPFMAVRKSDFKSATGDKIKFYPSAIAVHPVTHDIYILSTRETKGMAIFTHNGTFKSIQMIERAELLQPEGICFSPDGTLYISTEGRKETPAYIFSFNPVK